MRSAGPKTRLALILRVGATFAALVVSQPSSATVIADESFAYAAGDLNGANGGTGDWKSAWSAASELDVALGSYSYTDSLGNQLGVSGGHVELDSDPGGFKKADRTLNYKLGTIDETFWFGAIIDGALAASVNNIGLGDGLFFGQGTKDSGTTTWGLADQNGLIADTGIAADAAAFLLVRVDFTAAGDETVWLWVDPNLNLEPLLIDADASGAAASFEADFLRAQLETFGGAGFDELRLGTTFAEAAPLPEPHTSALIGLGLIASSIAGGSRSAGRAKRRSPKLRRGPLGHHS